MKRVEPPVVPLLIHFVMRPATYLMVFDERKRRIRGLWKRNGWFYARLTSVDPMTGQKSTRRVRLEKASTVAEAKIALQNLQKDRRDQTLPVLKQSPHLAEYWNSYFAFYDQAVDAKRASTIRHEKSSKKRWLEHLGDIRLNQIILAKLNSFIAKRQADGAKPRTVNLDVIALRNVLKKAVDDGLIRSLPMENLRPLKVNQVKRTLVTPEDLENLCTTAINELPRTGQFLSDVIHLMASCGARIAETLRLRWTDVDFGQKQITVGSDGLAKNRKHRVVDFNPALEAHLLDMFKRRPQDSIFLFPSPRGEGEDVPIVNFNKALRSACEKAKLTKFGFHDCRHYFISHCVMAGIDYMTIARWVGHQDGGVLIGKVYGHLSNEHAKRQAGKLVLPTVPAKST